MVTKGLGIVRDKIEALPSSPGVYIFKDAQGKIIYIGKARSLKKRVQSYFRGNISYKTRVLVEKIADIEYKVLPSETEAQLLEAALIKKSKPHYNISLKDDKSFPLIKISDEEFPVVCFYRRKPGQKRDKGLYFGPYTNVRLLRQLLKMIRRIFRFRSCKRMPKEPCLYFRLKLCPAPCIGKISAKEYAKDIQQIKMFLAYEYKKLLDSLSSEMRKLAEEKKFEEAAQVRERINALGSITKINTKGELEELKNLLKLDKLPERIEAFDISCILGQEACGSMVSFYRGIPDKNNYRRFRIKTVDNIDDYAMIREVIQRRYSRLACENLPLPDLILIDGGRGHLLTAEGEVKNLGLNIPLVGIAKEKENIYISKQKNPIKLKSDTPALNLIRRIRDEAHRFALFYHHVLRRKKMIGR